MSEDYRAAWIRAAEERDRLAAENADLRLILHVRRGLSDLRKAGIVCKGEDRRCEVSGRMCNTWRVVTR